MFFRRGGTGVGFGKACERDYAVEINPDWSFYYGDQDLIQMITSGASRIPSSLVPEGDNRNVNTTPNDYNNKLLFKGIKANSTIGLANGQNYSYVLGIRGWSDSSGGDAVE